MSDYSQLLDATIHHLEDLKSHGTRHVAVSAETLRSLLQPPPKFSIRQQSVEVANLPLPAGEGRGEGESISNPKSSNEKSAAFAALRERVMACAKCEHLASSRKNVVFGIGNIDAQLMFVGEAPGADEDIQGEPFVGRAGELLTKIIQAMGL